MKPRYEQPLAIVGMSLRLPGAKNTSEYWDLLCAESIAVGLRCGCAGPCRNFRELARETFDDANIPPDQLAGSSTGVFVDGVTVDTGSGSLIAFHLACESLRRGEHSMALAGGVNASGGYACGEGALVLLKPLDAALRDGNHVYAVVRGTGSNRDRDAAAKEALIRQVYSHAHVPLDRVRYVEAQGTASGIGDTAEVSVLGKTFGAGRSERDRCIVGSAKAAIGHLAAAAGVAGLTKTALCLYLGEIPPQANAGTANSKIRFEDLGLRLPRGREPMPTDGGPVYAGVNSFGYRGTNAHVVLEAAPF